MQQTLLSKEVLNLKETARYLEISESHLYHLTSSGVIPNYKPNGKKLYFNRKELDGWLLSNRQHSVDDIDERVSNLQFKSGRN